MTASRDRGAVSLPVREGDRIGIVSHPQHGVGGFDPLGQGGGEEKQLLVLAFLIFNRTANEQNEFLQTLILPKLRMWKELFGRLFNLFG